MSDEKIIRFPGSGRAKSQAGAPTLARSEPGKAKPAAAADAAAGIPELGALAPEQKKAMEIVLSGMAFVLVGIRPTQSGADFWTALHGEPADLRNAQPNLDAVIARAYVRKGV